MDLNNKEDMQVASLEYTGNRVIIRDSEDALIGSILRGGAGTFERVKEIVTPEMFGNISYGEIWNAIEKVHETGLGIDTITVGDELERSHKLDEVSNGTRTGRALLSDLRILGDPRHAESYAENVQDYHFKKKLEEYGKRMVIWSANGRRAADIIKDVDKLLGEINLYSSRSTDHIWDMPTAVSEAYNETQNAMAGKIKSVKTGLIDLDVMLNGGMRGSQLILLGARPGQGKTALLVTITLNAAREGKRSLIFSHEMTAVELTHRLLSQISGIAVDRLISGRVQAEEWEAYIQAVETLEKLPITIVDLPAMKISLIRQMARREMAKKKYDFIGLDYIQLALPDKGTERRQLDIGQVSRGLKALAKELDVPILAAAQLNRSLEQRSEKRPMLSDLREAGDLEQDADIVVFIYRDVEGDKNIAELIVSKHRNGAVGTVDVIYRAPMTRFDNGATKTISLNARY